jgi:AcrR family transcriptional regulator
VIVLAADRLMAAPKSTLRFAEKRELILDGAARLFNRRGIKAGTLAEVADSVGLATNSLTYYYRKKEDLVCACLLRSIVAISGVIAQAAVAGTLAERIRSFVHGFVALMADVAERRRPELIFFSDMRALPPAQAEPVFSAYVEMFRQLRRLLRQGQSEVASEGRRALNARTHLLLAEMLWARVWLARYEPVDYPRVAAAMTDILLHGMAASGQQWPAPAPLPPPPGAVDAVALSSPSLLLASPVDASSADALRDAYLRTATRLINDHGVGGASVERIAATLALTKGSFYHHHDTKEALVDDCFERSFALIRRLQLAALAQGGSGWQQLMVATVPLVAAHDPAQVGSAGDSLGPVLRLTAWSELPGALRWQKFNTLNRLGERFAAIITAGMVDGSVRLIDPAVAAQLIGGLVNALAEIDHWVPGADRQPLASLLARPLLLGLLAGPAVP